MHFLKDKKYVIEPTDPEKAKRFRVPAKDINEANHEYRQWLKAVRRSTDWRPVKKVQKTDIFNNEPGIAMVGDPQTVEKYNLDWVHQDAQASSSSEEGDDIPFKADMKPKKGKK